MNKHRLISLLIACFVTQIYLSQFATIKGVVKDKTLEIPLGDVFVSADKITNHAHSDINGVFVFSKLPYGTYELDFEKPGYAKQHLQIDISSSDTLQLTILLESTAVKLTAISIAIDKPVSAASSTYISQSTFENRPKNSAQDLLRLVPGLFIAQHAGGGKAEQIFVRGFDCDHGTDIATFVDGMPVNMPSHAHGQGYADLHFLIPEVVEGMNVFKGTSSPLYGDFATGAAVNFKTYDSLPKNLIQLEGGSVPSTSRLTNSRTMALINVPDKSNRINSYVAIDNVINSGYFDINQHFKRLNLFSKTTIQLNEFSKLQLSIGGFGSSWNASGQIPERAVQSGLISRFGSIDPNEGGTTQRNNYHLTYTAKVGSGEFETQAYTSTYRFKLFSDFTFFLNDSVHGDMIEQDDNRTVRGLNTKYSMVHQLFNMTNKFTIGATFRADVIENQLWHSPHRERMDVHSHSMIHQRSSAFFVNEVFRFNDHFRAEIGFRYDYFIFDVDDYLPSDSTHTNYSGFNYQTAVRPKVNLIYTASENLQFFLNSGSGYHSNDARSSVQDKNNHQLPLAVSGEFGSLFKLRKTVVSTSFWAMDMSNELVYIGDAGTTENKGASRRIGIDFSLRSQLSPWLFLDIDINSSKGRLIDTLFGTQLANNYYIPLAPTLTSVGGLTAKFKKGFEFGIRYRYLHNRPANQSNSVIAQGYNVVDFTANYKSSHYKIGLVIENLLNTQWNEAQFATETRLKNESKSVEELHFTPGTPFFAKLVIGYIF